MPQRTFKEARSAIEAAEARGASAETVEQMRQELADQEEAARERVRAQTADRRERVQAELDELLEEVKWTAQELKRVRRQYDAGRLKHPRFVQTHRNLIVRRQSLEQAVEQRQKLLANSEDEVQRAPEQTDRIAENLGKGKPEFSF